jgi:hypothetical protein
MPHFRFLFTDGISSIMQVKEVELPTPATAKMHAAEIARVLTRDAAHADEDWYRWQVQVIDETGRAVVIEPFLALIAPDGPGDSYERRSGGLRDIERFSLMAFLLLGAVFAMGVACATAFVPIPLDPLSRAATVCGSGAAACLALAVLDRLSLWDAI